MDSPYSSSGSKSTKLQKKCRKEKHNVSYDGDHRCFEIKNDVTITPPSSVIHQKQKGRGKGLQEEELVKYMSKLPSYLERGEKSKDKHLNLGVLDWHALEKWQNYLPPSSRYSTSSSVTSSSLWTDGSSNRYERGDDTCSPSTQKGRRLSLNSYLNIPPVGRFEHVESRAWNGTDYADVKAIRTSPIDEEQSIPREPVLPTRTSELKLKNCKGKYLDSQHIFVAGSSKRFQNYDGLSSSKGKFKVQGYASKMESEKLQNQCNDIVFPMPRDNVEGNHHCLFNLTGGSGLCLEEDYGTNLNPSNSSSCIMTDEIEGGKEPCMQQTFSCSPLHAIKSVSRATNKILEEKSSMMHIDSTKCLKVLNMKGTNSDFEARDTSPSCRLSFVLNRIKRSSNSRDSSDVTRFSSDNATAKSASKIADCFVGPSDQSNAVSESSSPFKKLLNPLLKTKVANSNFADHLQKNLASTRRVSTSYDEQGELSSVHQMKVISDLTNLRFSNLKRPCHNKIQRSSMVQAYFQVSAKNDLPLFTFAVENGDALAATLRKFPSRKDDPTWSYTFFSIDETRRKSGGWLTHGSKFKDYVPTVVAQMKVSDLPITNLGECLTIDQLRMRKFVLYAVGMKKYDYQICDMKPHNELAAIVVKFPTKTATCVKDTPQNVKGSSNSRDMQEDTSSVGSQELFSTTVLLPGGIHGLPSKGEPSPLIERWLSGGHCDCGGWDLGCKVKVLSNQNQKLNGQFELFSQSQNKAQQMTPLFRLSSLKNGTFSVEFSSSLSLLQAFSICIAVFDSMKSSGLQLQENQVEETTLPDACRLRNPKLVEADVPARFAS